MGVTDGDGKLADRDGRLIHVGDIVIVLLGNNVTFRRQGRVVGFTVVGECTVVRVDLKLPVGPAVTLPYIHLSHFLCYDLRVVDVTTALASLA